MELNQNYKKLLRYLKDGNQFQLYRHNVINQWNTWLNVHKFSKPLTPVNRTKDFIGMSFQWNITAEGFNFWSDLNDQWEVYYIQRIKNRSNDTTNKTIL